MTDHTLLVGFACGYLTCAVGAVVGWSLARWMGARKAKRVVRVEKAAGICRREAELEESFQRFCAAAYAGTIADFDDQCVNQIPPTAHELEVRRQLGIDYTGPTVLFTK